MLSFKLFRLIFCLFRFNRNTETRCFGIEGIQRNKRFVSDSAETSFGSSFGCFESKLVSKDTLVPTFLRPLCCWRPFCFWRPFVEHPASWSCCRHALFLLSDYRLSEPRKNIDANSANTVALAKEADFCQDSLYKQDIFIKCILLLHMPIHDIFSISFFLFLRLQFLDR